MKYYHKVYSYKQVLFVVYSSISIFFHFDAYHGAVYTIVALLIMHELKV